MFPRHATAGLVLTVSLLGCAAPTGLGGEPLEPDKGDFVAGRGPLEGVALESGGRWVATWQGLLEPNEAVGIAIQGYPSQPIVARSEDKDDGLINSLILTVYGGKAANGSDAILLEEHPNWFVQPTTRIERPELDLWYFFVLTTDADENHQVSLSAGVDGIGDRNLSGTHLRSGESACDRSVGYRTYLQVAIRGATLRGLEPGHDYILSSRSAGSRLDFVELYSVAEDDEFDFDVRSDHDFVLEGFSEGGPISFTAEAGRRYGVGFVGAREDFFVDMLLCGEPDCDWNCQ